VNYVTEPPTAGKVLLQTSYGPIDIELWSKEAPKATRNFVQLCLEGYYNQSIFHRVVKNYLVQTGDPTGSGFGGESIYGAPFSDEYHSRLRFSHRGIVACASFEKNKNGSQFFITLDIAPELNKKNTIFGKVTGDSFFNLLRFNSLEVDSNDRPVKPPRIISVEVLWNPFEDIVPRPKEIKLEPVVDTKPKITTPVVRNLSLLSFGDEAKEDELDQPPIKISQFSSTSNSNTSKATLDNKDEDNQIKHKKSENENSKKKPELKPSVEKETEKEEQSEVQKIREETKKLVKELKGSKNDRKRKRVDDEEREKKKTCKRNATRTANQVQSSTKKVRRRYR